MKAFKKKRALVATGITTAVLAIGATIAYYSDSMIFANLFHLEGGGEDVYKEIFIPEEDWTPCEEVPKTATATNKYDHPRYVRMQFTEYWRKKNTETPTTDHETTDLPLTWETGGETHSYAVINTQNADKWAYNASDGWFYYDHALETNEETLSYFKSVTLNCEMNSVGEIRYSVDGKSGESIPNEYADADYHIYIHFQMSDEDMRPARQTLYDIVAEQTQGTDENVNYLAVDFNQPRDNGVFTFASTSNDQYPVHYYRGVTGNNRVLFGGYCWYILRTAEKGSVKLLYDSYPENGKCTSTPYTSAGVPTIIGRASWKNENRSASVGEYGYMWGDRTHHNDWVQYPLTKADFFANVENGTIPALENTTDSDIKNYIEGWFEGIEPDAIYSPDHNLLALEDKLEDVPYCNDRSVAYTSEYGIAFGALTRLASSNSAPSGFPNSNSHNPNLGCPRGTVDQFTVSTANGNGKLKHKIALPTADEMVLAGAGADSYMNVWHRFWTMTPGYYAQDSQGMMHATYDNYGKLTTYWQVYGLSKSPNPSNNSAGGYVKPVVSLIHNTYVASGNGTGDSPYILEW